MYAQLALARQQRADRIKRMKEHAKDLQGFKGEAEIEVFQSHIIIELIELVGEVVDELDALTEMTGN